MGLSTAPYISRGTARDETLESINRRLEENQWRITRLDPSPAYYVVSSPLEAGVRSIKATEWMDQGNGLAPEIPLSILIPDTPIPITETDDGFTLNFRPGALYGGLVRVSGPIRYRYGFHDRQG